MRSGTIACLMVCASGASVIGARDDGLVACWDFDEGAGNILHDSLPRIRPRLESAETSVLHGDLPSTFGVMRTPAGRSTSPTRSTS